MQNGDPVNPNNLDPNFIPENERSKIPEPNKELAARQRETLEGVVKRLLASDTALSTSLTNIINNYGSYQQDHPDAIMGRLNFVWRNLGSILHLIGTLLYNYKDVKELYDYFVGTKYNNLKDVGEENNVLRGVLANTALTEFLPGKDFNILFSVMKTWTDAPETNPDAIVSKDLFNVLGNLLGDQALTTELNSVVQKMFGKLSTGQGDWVEIVGGLVEAIDKVPGMKEMLKSKAPYLEKMLFDLSFDPRYDHQNKEFVVYLSNPMGINMAAFGILQDKEAADGRLAANLQYINNPAALIRVPAIIGKDGKVDLEASQREISAHLNRRVNKEIFSLVPPILKRENGLTELRQLFTSTEIAMGKQVANGEVQKISFIELADQATKFLEDIKPEFSVVHMEFAKMLKIMLPPFIDPKLGINEKILGIMEDFAKTPEELNNLIKSLNGGDPAELVGNLRALLKVNPGAIKYISNHREDFSSMINEMLKDSFNGHMASIGAKLPEMLSLLGNSAELLISDEAVRDGGLLDSIHSILLNSRNQSAANSVAIPGILEEKEAISRQALISVLGTINTDSLRHIAEEIANGSSLEQALQVIVPEQNSLIVLENFKIILGANNDINNPGPFLENIASALEQQVKISRTAQAVYAADSVILDQKGNEIVDSLENRKFLTFLKTWNAGSFEDHLAQSHQINEYSAIRLRNVLGSTDVKDTSLILQEYQRILIENATRKLMDSPAIKGLDIEVSAYLFSRISKVSTLNEIDIIMADYPFGLTDEAKIEIRQTFSLFPEINDFHSASRVCSTIAQATVTYEHGMTPSLMKATASLLDGNKGDAIIGFTKRFTQSLLEDKVLLERSLKIAQKLDTKTLGVITSKIGTFLEEENINIRREAEKLHGSGSKEANAMIQEQQALLANVVNHYIEEVPFLTRSVSLYLNGKMPLDMITNLVKNPTIFSSIGENFEKSDGEIGSAFSTAWKAGFGNILGGVWELGIGNLVQVGWNYKYAGRTSDLDDAGVVESFLQKLQEQREQVVLMTSILSEVSDAEIVRSQNISPEKLESLNDVKSRKCALDYVKLQDVNFSKIDLSGYSFIGAKLTSVSFENAIIKDVDFANTDFKGNISFKGATLNAATFASILERKQALAHLGNAVSFDFSEVKLIGDFKDFQFSSGIDLTNADLSQVVSLEGANFHNTVLTGVQVNPKLMSESIGLSANQLEKALSDEVMPIYAKRQDLVIKKAFAQTNLDSKSWSSVRSISDFLNKNHSALVEKLANLSLKSVLLYLGHSSQADKQTNLSVTDLHKRSIEAKIPAHLVEKKIIDLISDRMKFAEDKLSIVDEISSKIAEAVIGAVDLQSTIQAQAINQQLVSYLAKSTVEMQNAFIQRYQDNPESVLREIKKGGLIDVFYQNTHYSGIRAVAFDLDINGLMKPSLSEKLNESMTQYMLGQILITPDEIAILNNIAQEVNLKNKVQLLQQFQLAFGSLPSEEKKALIDYIQDNKDLLSGQYTESLASIVTANGVKSKELPSALCKFVTEHSKVDRATHERIMQDTKHIGELLFSNQLLNNAGRVNDCRRIEEVLKVHVNDIIKVPVKESESFLWFIAMTLHNKATRPTLASILFGGIELKSDMEVVSNSLNTAIQQYEILGPIQVNQLKSTGEQIATSMKLADLNGFSANLVAVFTELTPEKQASALANMPKGLELMLIDSSAKKEDIAKAFEACIAITPEQVSKVSDLAEKFAPLNMSDIDKKILAKQFTEIVIREPDLLVYMEKNADSLKGNKYAENLVTVIQDTNKDNRVDAVVKFFEAERALDSQAQSNLRNVVDGIALNLFGETNNTSRIKDTRDIQKALFEQAKNSPEFSLLLQNLNSQDDRKAIIEGLAANIRLSATQYTLVGKIFSDHIQLKAQNIGLSDAIERFTANAKSLDEVEKIVKLNDVANEIIAVSGITSPEQQSAIRSVVISSVANLPIVDRNQFFANIETLGVAAVVETKLVGGLIDGLENGVINPEGFQNALNQQINFDGRQYKILHELINTISTQFFGESPSEGRIADSREIYETIKDVILQSETPEKIFSAYETNKQKVSEIISDILSANALESTYAATFMLNSGKQLKPDGLSIVTAELEKYFSDPVILTEQEKGLIVTIAGKIVDRDSGLNLDEKAKTRIERQLCNALSIALAGLNEDGRGAVINQLTLEQNAVVGQKHVAPGGIFFNGATTYDEGLMKIYSQKKPGLLVEYSEEINSHIGKWMDNKVGLLNLERRQRHEQGNGINV